MTNLKKSLLILFALGSMQQLVPVGNLTFQPGGSTPRLGAGGAGQLTSVSVYDLKTGKTGLYDRASRTANMNGQYYIITTEYTPLYQGTLNPTIEGSVQFGAFNQYPNVKTFLYGVPTSSPVVS